MLRIDLSRLNELCHSVPEILGVWVFGSAKEGKKREESDLDIAVLFTHKPSFDLLASLRSSLQEAIEIDGIDLVVLNESSPILRFEAVNGRLLFCRDRQQCAEFVSLSAREYESEMAMIEKWVRKATVDYSFR